MKKNIGIEISDNNGKVLTPTLEDIVDVIENGNDFHWFVLFIDGIPHKENGVQTMKFIKDVNDSKFGFKIKFNNMKQISRDFFQMYKITALLHNS